MNPFVSEMAKELAKHVNRLVDLPLMNEDEERLLFEFIITKVLEITASLLGKQLTSHLGSGDSSEAV
jgi:hypothetical protein